MKVGIVGMGGIGLASAVWTANRGHRPMLWSPRNNGDIPAQESCIESAGLCESNITAYIAQHAEMLVNYADAILIAVPVNGHKSVIDTLLPYLRSNQTVIISSMASLSSLYLYEMALTRGVAITVASFGTTVLTARRQKKNNVQIMTRRASLGVSCLPKSQHESVLALCESLFGDGFALDENVLFSALTNVNPVTHGPLALFNWTRIELGENWPQYYYMTPRIAAVIEQLDDERRSVAKAFGLTVRTISEHFLNSFNVTSKTLADIAVELHEKRGGPPGPTNLKTRFLHEDIPYGLAFTLMLGEISKTPVPATNSIVTTAGLISGSDFFAENNLTGALRLPDETIAGLLARVNAY